MKISRLPVYLALFCACWLDAAAAAGGKGAKGAKSGPLLGAAATSAPAVTTTGHGGGGGVAAGALGGRLLYVDPRRVPPMDPERKVSEQDCTKPVDLTQGNLKCK